MKFTYSDVYIIYRMAAVSSSSVEMANPGDVDDGIRFCRCQTCNWQATEYKNVNTK